MSTARAIRARRPMVKAARPTYELRSGAWKVLADQDPQLFYRGRDPEPNITAIAEYAGLSQTTLTKLKKNEQQLSLEVFASLTNFLVSRGWGRLEAQEALFKPVRFAAKRRLVAA